MSEIGSFTKVSSNAVGGLVAAGVGALDVYLPGAPGEAPVLYRGAHAASPSVDLERLREHRVTHVYVRNDTLLNCEKAIEQRLGMLLSNPRLRPAEKAQILHTAGSFVARELLDGPEQDGKLDRVSKLADCLIQGVLADPEIAVYLLQMAGHERSTASHMQMVSSLAVIFGAELLGNDSQALRDLAIAGLLHDIGKLSIPSEVLQKRGALAEHEVQMVHQHPIESVRLLGRDEKVSAAARQIILQHHERLDGRGYPLGLRADEIPLGTRVLTIVDSFHAMIGPRAYRAQLSVTEANHIMSLQAGKQFDADLLKCWDTLCARQASTEGMALPAAADRRDDTVSRGEQLCSSTTARRAQQRRPRYVCANSVMVRCIYAGRLEDATCAPDDFSACVFDVSRGGMCIFSAFPMYRGEVLNIRTKPGADGEWLRAMVAWCRIHEPSVFKVGLRFLSRIPDTDVTERHTVLPMGQLVPPAESAAAAPAADAASEKPARKQYAQNNYRDDALRRLSAIACMRNVSRDAERTAVVLSTAADVQVRTKAIEVLVQIDTPASRDALAAMLHDQHRGIRMQVIQELGANRVTQAIDALREILDDADEEVVLTAAEALGRLNDWSGITYVTRTLTDDGPHVRLAVRAFSHITGKRFSSTREGIASARRYLEAQKKELLRRAREAMPVG